MEENLFSINAMKQMEVIDINSGSKIGNIKDIKIDQKKYYLESYQEKVKIGFLKEKI